MPADSNLSALPEAIPLRSVSPAWRVLAILALVGAAALLVVVGVLGFALISDSSRNIPTAMAPPPFAPAFPPPLVAQSPASPDEDEPERPAEPDDPRTSPFPLRADLAEAEQRPSVSPADTPARRFLQLGEDVWSVPRMMHLDHLAVSSNGGHMAAVFRRGLLIGTPQQGLHVTVNGNEEGGDEAQFRPGVAGGDAGAPGRPPGFGTPMLFPPGGASEAIQVVGIPTWTRGKPVVWYATSRGQIRSYQVPDVGNQDNFELVSATGTAGAALSTSPAQLVLVRRRTIPKWQPPNKFFVPDPTEVVLWQENGQKERVLIPRSATEWQYPAVSPDNKQVAFVTAQDLKGFSLRKWNLHVLDLAGGSPRVVGSPAAELGPPCWTPDGKGLLYAGSQRPLPTDHFLTEAPAQEPDLDLFHFDLASGTETRLTRGGGFFSPSVDHYGNLYYLTARGNKQYAGLKLRRMALSAALEFAKKEGPGTTRVLADWLAVVEPAAEDKVLKPETDGASVTAEQLAQNQLEFARRYEERFKSRPPATREALQYLRHELANLPIPGDAHRKFQLQIGIWEGQFLCREYKANWHLVKGSLVSPRHHGRPQVDQNPFVAVFDPFSLWLDEDGDMARQFAHLEHLLRNAAGRQIVLTNDPNNNTDWLKEFADPDLERGEKLLREAQKEEGVRVLRELLQREQHQENAYLALHVGALLYEHGMMQEVVDLMKRHARRPGLAAEKYNLLGLAQIGTNPQEAISSFRTALRHNLQHSPAFLNLAMAYEKANDFNAAVLCLRRYLQSDSIGPYGRDAQRRLGELQDRLSSGTPNDSGPQGASSPPSGSGNR